MKLHPRRIACSTRAQAEARGAVWVGAATCWDNPYSEGELAPDRRAALYRDFIRSDARKAGQCRDRLGELRGRPLACPDPAGPSYADVLVELANADALESHPLADLFPMMSEGEFASLVTSMRTGYLPGEEIMLLDGMVLDGRNRYLALRQVCGEGVFDWKDCEPTGWGFVKFQATDIDGLLDDATVERGPLAYVIAKNLPRRHLDESQRAMVAARIANMRQGERTDKPSANLQKVSQGEAARSLNVSTRSVASAAKVQEKATPEVLAAVDAGTLPVSLAEKVVELPPEKQAAIVAAPDVARQARTEVSRHTRDVAEQRQGAKAAAWPEGKRYNIILVDIPRKWNARSDETGAEKSPDNHYRTMTFEQQLGLGPKVRAIAADDSMCVYWTTPASLLDDIEVLAEWGFIALRPRDAQGLVLRGADGLALPRVGLGRYSSEQVWNKIYPGQQTGMGLRFWGVHESILYGVRGKFVGPRRGEQPRSLFDAPVGEHSAKPPDIQRWLDLHYPNSPKIELFRRHDPANPLPEGWDVFGDEAVQRAVREAMPSPVAAVRTAPAGDPWDQVEEIPDFLRRSA